MEDLNNKIYFNEKYSYIKVKYLTSEQLTTIKNKLTVKPKNDFLNNNKVKPIKLYKLEKGILYLPRNWSRKNIGEGTKDRIKYYSGDKIDIKSKIKLKDYQVEPVNIIYNKLLNDFGTQLCVGCGFGKTVCALYLLSKIKIKTLIIVHKTLLLEQWIERIKMFLPDAKFGKIIQNTFDIENKDIVIASLQSILSKTRNYNHNHFKSFGFTIYDESHHISSTTFHKCISIVSTKYNLGLSATPKRLDGLECIFEYYIGEIGYKQEVREDNIKPNIKIINYSSKEELVVKKMWNGSINMNSLIKQVIEDEDRNKVISDLVSELIKDEKRQILLVSHRISHIKTLLKIIQKITDNVGLYIGGIKKDKLEENSKCKVIIASYQLMSEGTDIPTLNTLILCTPKKDVNQVVGRILRKYTGIIPEVYDIIDECSVFYGQSKKRKTFYRKQKYKIIYEQEEIEEDDFKINECLF
jgi:superfamily II DNA or RNA helicase